jgi:hypothetical protein
VSHSVTRGAAAGAIRWLAPELIFPNTQTPTIKTSEADVFSFGRVCLSVGPASFVSSHMFIYILPQICTQRHPFHDIPNDIAVIMQVMAGKNPHRPTGTECNGLSLSDHLWTIVAQCWEALPEDRPDMRRIVTALGEQSNFTSEPAAASS